MITNSSLIIYSQYVVYYKFFFNDLWAENYIIMYFWKLILIKILEKNLYTINDLKLVRIKNIYIQFIHLDSFFNLFYLC